MKFLFRTPFIPFFLIPLLVGQPVWAQAPLSTSDEAGGGSNLQLRVVSADGSQLSTGSRSARGFTIQVTDLRGAPVPDAAVAFRLPDSGSSGIFPDGSHSAVVYTDGAGTAHVDGIRWSETPGTAALRVTANKGSDHAGLLVEQTLVSPGASSVTSPVQSVRSTPLPPSPAVLRGPIPTPVLEAPTISVESITRKGASPSDPSFRRLESEPSVSIVSSPQENSIGSSKKKWIILGIALAAGVGAGFAFKGKGSQSNSTTAPTSSISFGSPTVSVGQP
jgi:hypothetical protein